MILPEIDITKNIYSIHISYLEQSTCKRIKKILIANIPGFRYSYELETIQVKGKVSLAVDYKPCHFGTIQLEMTRQNP